MRKTAIALLLIIAIALCCSKSNHATILGNWTFTEYYHTPAYIGHWSPASQWYPDETYVEFQNDRTFSSDVAILGTGRYEIYKDTLTMSYSNGSKMKWIYGLSSKQLILWPINGPCIELCGWKFKK